jgi:hypothetical protein
MPRLDAHSQTRQRLRRFSTLDSAECQANLAGPSCHRALHRYGPIRLFRPRSQHQLGRAQQIGRSIAEDRDPQFSAGPVRSDHLPEHHTSVWHAPLSGRARIGHRTR